MNFVYRDVLVVADLFECRVRLLQRADQLMRRPYRCCAGAFRLEIIDDGAEGNGAVGDAIRGGAIVTADCGSP